MKKLLLLSFCFITLSVSAQNNENPYWQQTVNYKIKVTLNDKNHTLSGFETIEYTNNSDEALDYMYIHLWPNAYKNNQTTLAKQQLENGDTKLFYAEEKDLGYIDSLDFLIDGKPVKWELLADTPDVAKIKLNEFLLPNKTITITTPFKVKLPASFSRLGHVGQSYQITQWYPKPAVYDKNGWNYMPYLDQGEFYSEYGNFDVSITLPSNYVVGATGDLQTESEQAFLDEKFRRAKRIKDFSERSDEFPPSSSEMKTIRYVQDKVHDFAWFADKRYHVLKGEIALPYSKRKVTTYVMFTNKYGNLWKDALEYVDSSTYYYSKWVGEYPYNVVTAVDGALSAGGGMEYPTITVIGAMGTAESLDLVIAHEVGHNWFYGILGSNERLYPWMDEGINSYYETRYMIKRYGTTNFISLPKFLNVHLKPRSLDYLGYHFQAHRGEDQAMEVEAYNYTNLNYGVIVYKKSAASLNYLANYLGQETFDNCMNNYFENWKFKHPQPQDIENEFEKTVQKNLDWFFKDHVKTTKKLDFKLAGIKQNKTENNILVKVKNKSEILAPVPVSSIDENGKALETKWLEGFEGEKTLELKANEVAKIRIDNEEVIPEYNLQNNTANLKKLLKKREPLKLQFLGSLDDPQKTQLNYFPAIGYNLYDGFMAGLALYNSTAPSKDFEFVLVPMYAFGSGELVGHGSINQYFYPTEKFKSIKIGVSGKSYNYRQSPNEIRQLDGIDTSMVRPRSRFFRIVPEIEFTFKPKSARSPITQTLRIRSVITNEEALTFEQIIKPDSSSIVFYTGKENKMTSIQQITYTFENAKTLNPYSVVLDLQQGFKADDFTLGMPGNFMRLSATGNFRLDYQKPKKGLDVRVFAGVFVQRDFEDFRSSRADFRLNAYTGQDDYLYEGVFGGRTATDGFFGNQIMMQDGGFKAVTPALNKSIGRNNNWLLATNISSTLPGKIPFKLFADLGLFPDNSNNQSSTQFVYTAGVSIPIIKNVCEIYIPFLISDEIDLNLGDKKWYEKITFTFELQKANPFELIRKIQL